MLPIVYCHLGLRVAPHLIDSIRQSQRMSPETPIFAILSDDSTMVDTVGYCGAEVVLASQLERSSDHRLFEASINRNAGRKQGFWVYSTERFFYIEAVMRRCGFDRVLHLESDNLIFFDLAGLEGTLGTLYSGLAAPFLNDSLCVPGVVYIGSLDVLGALNAHIAQRVLYEKSHRSLIARLRSPRVRMGTPLNDMNLLAGFRERAPEGAFLSLPTMSAAYESERRAALSPAPPSHPVHSTGQVELGLIFDAAAIGQYLMGVDRHFHPRASGGSFVNPDAMLDPRDFEFALERDEQGRVRPVMRRNGKEYAIGSIHNHAKVNLIL